MSNVKLEEAIQAFESAGVSLLDIKLFLGINGDKTSNDVIEDDLADILLSLLNGDLQEVDPDQIDAVPEQDATSAFIAKLGDLAATTKERSIEQIR